MIRRFFASIFIFVLCLSIIPIFLLFSVLRTYFNVSFVRDEIIPASYDVFVPIAVNAATVDRPDDAIFKESFIKTFNIVLPKDEYVRLAQQLLQAFVAELPTYSETGEISLVEVRKHLIAFISQSFQKLPSCASEEEFVAKVQKKDEIPNCLPPGQGRIVFEDRMKELIELDMPTRIVMPKNEKFETIDFIALTFKYKQLLQVVLMIIPALLLGIIALIIFKPFGAVLRWIGMSMFFSGAMGSGLGFILTSFVDFMKQGTEVDPIPESIIRFMLHFPEVWVWRNALIIGIAGVILFIVSIRFGKRATVTIDGEHHSPKKIVVRDGMTKKGRRNT